MAGPPYPLIAKALRGGQVIPFLGAGASFGTRNPKDIPWRKKVKGKWEVSFLPAGSELAAYLAELAKFPDENLELTRVSQYFKVIAGDQTLRESLFEIFEFSHDPWPIHKYLADIAKNVAMLIVTTNYDELMERALKDAGVPFDTVQHLTDDSSNVLWRPHGQNAERVAASSFVMPVPAVTTIYKIHGAIDHATRGGQYVITEDDYVEFLTRMGQSTAIPSGFAEPFRTRHFLFLGYGLYDWNVRVVLNRVRPAAGPLDKTSWAIETLSKPLEKKFWTKRGVEVFDKLTLDKFVDGMRKAEKKL